jgi:hypothetical protein
MISVPRSSLACYKVDTEVLLDTMKYYSSNVIMKQNVGQCNRNIMVHPFPKSFKQSCQLVWNLEEGSLFGIASHKG